MAQFDAGEQEPSTPSVLGDPTLSCTACSTDGNACPLRRRKETIFQRLKFTPERTRILKPQLFFAEFFDLVSEAGGFFEFEIGGGFAHLFFEIGDDGP